MSEEPIIITIDNSKRDARVKKIWKVIISIPIVLVLLYVVAAIFFAYRYTENTVISGTPKGLASKSRVYEEYRNAELEVPVIFTGRHEGEVQIYLKDVCSDIKYDLSNLDSKPEITKGLGWIGRTITGRELTVYADVKIDGELLDKTLGDSVLCDPKLAKEPQNAYIDKYDDKIKGYAIKAGNPGNILDKELVEKAVIKYVENGVDVNHTNRIIIDLEAEDCYKKSLISVDNAKLTGLKNKADKMVSAEIIYDWNGARVNVDGSVIKDWVEITDDDVILKEDKVADYVKRMADANDTFGKPMKFRTSLGKNITIQRGDYGWKTNVDKEIIALIDDIKNGVKITKEPEYRYKGYAKGQNDVGKSYVEVDLSNQHVYLYLKGKLVLETDCVSGNIAQGHKTPEGIYGITYKAPNATLRGPGYASFVYYWMPYCGGVGLHDATWRNKFGGDIYKTGGSHGCVNLPKSAAKQIYESVETNFPVVSYW